MPIFKSKEKKEQERQEKLTATVEKHQKPPNTHDTQGRPVNPKRTQYGYRGYDASKEPLADSVAERRANSGQESAASIRAKVQAKMEAERKAKLAINKDKKKSNG